MERTIMHIDMDAFFASVEQQCNPRLKGKPIAVIGAGKRTIVTTASYEARKFGVKTGKTVYEAKRLCPDIIFVVGNNDKYTDACARIVAILLRYSKRVEVYSIDESFLDLTGSRDDPVETAKSVKKEIKKELGLACSVGIGPNKLIAKLASDMSKPDGLKLVKPNEVQSLLENLPVKELCGIGKQTAAVLYALGIKTCGELGRAPVSVLRHRFGIIGEHLHFMGQGVDGSPVVPPEDVPEAKSIGHSMTLDKDESDAERLKVYILQLSEMVGRRLRREKMRGKTICLVVRYGDFQTRSRRRTVSEYIKDTDRIYDVAVEIFHSFRLDKAVRLLGVSVSNLVKDLEIPLFEADRKKDNLTQAVDELNDIYGDCTVTMGCLLKKMEHKEVISPSWRPSGPRKTV